MTSILIADDHDLVREAVAAHIKENMGVDASLAGSADEVLGLIAQSGPFDLVMLDVEMPGMHRLAMLDEIVAANMGGFVVIFSGTISKDTVHSAISRGARGYIPKTLSARTLINALHFVLAGEIFLPASLLSGDDDSRLDHAAFGEMNPTEVAVLRGLCEGATNKEIGRQLDLTEVIVKMHVRAICLKLGVTNRTQAAMTAVKNGLCV